jgi:glycosyltransferase involved in cell wall biosynthesis
MTHSLRELDSLRRIAVIGNYLPRQCGIATFTTDLCQAMASEAPDVAVEAVAINDVPEGYRYPATVRFEIAQNKLSDYRLVADFLNMNQFDLVCLQHEYGIFGGSAGSHILALLRQLRMPVITALHTVLKQPDNEKRLVLRELANLSDRLVVLSDTGASFLNEVYGVAESKIAFIHHGIPDMPFVDPNYYKDHFGVEGRRVILTFGLLAPGKGIEYMIEALPAIVKEYPDIVYIVLGATHPHIRRVSGEEYRLRLQSLVRELGLQEHVIFHNRFVELEKLCEFIGAADLYVTPYVHEAQIVSGTLAYAIGGGKAVISTPYWYAQDVLAGQRGRLVSFRSKEELSSQCIDLFANEVERHAMRKRAYTYSRDMIWKEVARQYLRLFAEAKADRETKPRPTFRAQSFESLGDELPEIELAHVRLLTDETGILQHCKFTVPDRMHGYSTDDNARALITILTAAKLLPDDPSLGVLAARYLSFLHYAFDRESGRFRNVLTFDRRWVKGSDSEDSHGRALLALGAAAVLERSNGQLSLAMELFHQALPAAERFSHPRSWALALIGIHHYLTRFHGDSRVRRVQRVLARRLFQSFEEHATDDWVWPNETVSYANGKLPYALLLCGEELRKAAMTEMGLRCLDWLLCIQTGPRDCFSPVGTNGWYVRGATKVHFDQQPIDAHAMVEACIEAYNVTREDRWLVEARKCFEWFLGRNDLHLTVYDYASGGCRDGLHPDRANENQGAESTLAWLLSLLAMYRYRSEWPLLAAGQSGEKRASRPAPTRRR